MKELPSYEEDPLYIRLKQATEKTREINSRLENLARIQEKNKKEEEHEYIRIRRRVEQLTSPQAQAIHKRFFADRKILAALFGFSMPEQPPFVTEGLPDHTFSVQMMQEGGMPTPLSLDEATQLPRTEDLPPLKKVTLPPTSPLTFSQRLEQYMQEEQKQGRVNDTHIAALMQKSITIAKSWEQREVITQPLRRNL